MTETVTVPREPDQAMHGAVSDLARALIEDPHERDQYAWFAIKAYRAMIAAAPQPAPAAEKGWRPIETAPKDGSLILTWCVHVNAEFCDDAVAEGYAGPVIAKWIDHNGGGWTWHGLAGTHTHWQPLPEPPSLSEERG
jgi:hypothetical protein